MVKTTLKIDAMACGMCEAHVNDAIRKAFSVKKVSSSHAKGRTEIPSDLPLEEPRLKAAVEASGYCVTSIQSEPYERKGFFLFKNNEFRQQQDKLVFEKKLSFRTSPQTGLAMTGNWEPARQTPIYRFAESSRYAHFLNCLSADSASG